MDVCASALGTYLYVFAGNYEFTAVIAVMCGDPVAPPELTGDAPVLDAL